MDLTELQHFDHTYRHPWELARLDIVKGEVGKLLRSRSAGAATVLDIGCGDAFVVSELAKAWPYVSFCGVDINLTEGLRKQLEDQHNLPNLKIYRSLDDVPLDPGAVDLVLLLDVIEHIEDEVGFLQSLNQYPFLRVDTDYLITVPAYQRLFAAHDVILGHYRRYSNKSLRRRLARAGLETKMERYFFLSLIPPRMFQLLKEKVSPRNVDTGSDLAAWSGGKFLTQVIKIVLWSDYRLGSILRRIGIKLPGLSNLVVCQRSA